MKLTILTLGSALSVNAAVLGERATFAVVGKPEGFATGTTGGGAAKCVAPGNVKVLKEWLMDSTPRCIVIDKEYSFKGTEGTTKANGCRPVSNKCPGKGGQDAINIASWCDNGNAGAGSKAISVTYDNAGISAINLGSNKSIIGVGSQGVIRGKGLRIANGSKNIIIQNVHITELNPQYIWGGDAITLAGTDMVWIDHCKISLVGRQMFVAGQAASNRVTLSNNEFDGQTSWSASCDNRHYWTFLALGSNDQITLKGNYIHHTSGRSPKIGGNTVLHAVNNFWDSNSGHAFDNHAGGHVLAEGNIFQNVATTMLGNEGSVFASPSSSLNTQCSANLKHTCAVNSYVDSPTIAGSDASVLARFQGKNAASVASTNGATIKSKAGVGKI
ncbi:polysaccharide lyase family 1 protein [Didymella exigua CBS 183.55]|uniref:pectin lyase n=1 Tax=Didymella exigua CBS 183.55 TaxID=1150837 RepID=A0A6A5S5S5_9PLEO|nr:polysaccharide lyase family 1 protein [Didymella exigua CBS 183.55]KAF1933846.1 polysaccharide lyase family 1 protein [Didymella exigua CBS 183.55]